MNELTRIAARFEQMHASASRSVGGAGLVDFASLLASARPVGPILDLPSDAAPSQLSYTAVPQFPASQAVTARFSTGTLPERAEQWSGAIAEAAVRNGVDVDLLTALVWTESAFRPDAVSPAGAVGLGQLMPGTAAGLGVDPHSPVENLDGAARYLRQQLDRFGSDELALAAYNAGPGRVMSAGGIPNIAETKAYVGLVMTRRDSLTGVER